MYLAQVVGQFFTGVVAEDFLVILQCIEVCIRRGTTRQAVAILDELDVAQTSRHATIAVGVEGVEVDADIAVAAGVTIMGSVTGCTWRSTTCGASLLVAFRKKCS